MFWVTKTSKYLLHVNTKMFIVTVLGKRFSSLQKPMPVIKTHEVGHHFGGLQ